MQSMILVMSLTGSGMYILYLILRPLLSKYFSVNTRINFLIAALLFYILPLPNYKNYYIDFISKFYDINTLLNKFKMPNVYQPIRIMPGYNGFYIPTRHIIIFCIISIWIAIVIMYFIHKYKSYNIMKTSLQSQYKACKDENIRKYISDCSNKLKIKKQITLLMSDEHSPLTMGYKEPIIVLNDKIEEKQLKYILRHELQHIKHNDFIINIMLALAVIMHFYNPFIYLLAREMKKLLEYRSDEAVVLDMDKEERKAYGKTIIDISTITDSTYGFKNIPVSTFGSADYKIMKERIKEMKKVRKHGKLNCMISSLILLISIISCSMLVFAYDNVRIEHLTEDSIEAMKENSEKGYDIDDIYHYEGGELPDTDMYHYEGELPADIEDTIDLGGKDGEFTLDENGNAVPVSETVSPKAPCNHTYVSSTVYEHTKNGSGGCTMKTYSIKKCSKCGATKDKRLIKTISYEVCPH